MLAAYAARLSPDDPLAGLEVGERPDPVAPDGWARVRVHAASLNHHDLWSLKGVGLRADQLPRILGCDGAGVTEDGREVVLHAVIADPATGPGGDETLDPGFSMLSEKVDGSLAEWVCVPERNLVPKPASLSWAEAASLPCAWLTAWRMLTTKAGVGEGTKVLVQGVGGGVATAAIALARGLGATVWATTRDEAKAERGRELGAHEVVATGARLSERMDVVIETVGKATWDHSLKCLRPGGTVVVSGATTGGDPSADLQRVFFRQLNVLGSTMGTLEELTALVAFLDRSGVRPLVDAEIPLADARTAFERMAAGDLVGKLVVTCT